MKTNDVEREANVFALFLLMPRDLLMAELLKLNGIDLSDGEQLKGICQKFQVTMTALTVRIGLLSKADKMKIGF